MTGRAGLEVDTLTIRIPMRLQRRGGRKLIVTPEGAAVPTPRPRRDETLVKALVRAHRWRRRIESGRAKSITDLAEQEGVTVAFVCRLLPLTCLAPEIVEAILDGRQPEALRLAEMLRNRSVGWEEQRTSLGFGNWRESFKRCARPRSSAAALSLRRVLAAEPPCSANGRRPQIPGSRRRSSGERVRC
jgi:hypothetical protein